MTDQTHTSGEQTNTDSTGSGSGAKKDGALSEWLAVGVGLTALLSIMSLIVAVVALSSSSGSTTTTIAQTVTPASNTTPLQPKAVKLVVKSDAQHAKKGPDGQWHDAFLGGNFSVKAGQSVTVTVSNYDDAPHSFTSPALGVNETIGGSTKSGPHTVTFTFKAPAKAGSYEWWCSLPCDPWAMSHDGYMRGHVTVTA